MNTEDQHSPSMEPAAAAQESAAATTIQENASAVSLALESPAGGHAQESSTPVPGQEDVTASGQENTAAAGKENAAPGDLRMFLVKLFPEIIIKSTGVRRAMTKQLGNNIRNVIRRSGAECSVSAVWDHITVKIWNNPGKEEITGLLSRIPGIHAFMEVNRSTFTDLHDIYLQTLEMYRDRLVGKTFCVRVKRRGEHSFTSVDVEKYVGGGLNQNLPTGGVKLKDPEVQVNLEIDGNTLYLIRDSRQGLGGYPIGTQEAVLSLISGGYDSGVSSFRFIRRGCLTHFCFFNMGGREHEEGVKQEAYYLWSRYGASHRVKFFAVPFEDVVGAILEHVNSHLMGVVLKRMMVRAASALAGQVDALALVTGESVGQVSSQTLTNLKVIEQASECMILRPLITEDKQTIIDQCRLIGTAEIAESMPEYCGVISQKPAVHAKLEDVLAEEAHFDFSVLDKAIRETVCLDMRDIGRQERITAAPVTTVTAPEPGDAVIDIRQSDEAEDSPLPDTQGAEILAIPFYRLATEFPQLDPNRRYLLYCSNGVMSRIHAAALREKGFANVAVLRRGGSCCAREA